MRTLGVMVITAAMVATAFAQQPQPLDPLESAIEQQLKAQVPSAVRMVPFWKGAGPKLDWMIMLHAGKCYAFAGAGSAGTQRLSLYLWGPDGKRVTEVKPWSPWATMPVCAPWTGQYRVQAKLDGVGVFAVGLYETGGPMPAAPAPTPAPVVVAPSPWGVTVSTPSVSIGFGGAPPPQCRMGTDGQNVCGYNCRMGTNGHMYCAATPDGRCAMNTDGTFTCSGAPSVGTYGGGPPPECRMGTDGVNTCGYNCRMGTDGHFYCASRPDGRCAFNSDGTFTCP